MHLFCCQNLDVTNDHLPVNHGGHCHNKLSTLAAIRNNGPVWCAANLKLFRNYRKEDTGLDPGRSTEGKVLHTASGLRAPPRHYGLIQLNTERKEMAHIQFSFFLMDKKCKGYSSVTESQNVRGWKGPPGHPVQPPCRSRVTYSRLHRTVSRLFPSLGTRCPAPPTPKMLTEPPHPRPDADPSLHCSLHLSGDVGYSQPHVDATSRSTKLKTTHRHEVVTACDLPRLSKRAAAEGGQAPGGSPAPALGFRSGCAGARSITLEERSGDHSHGRLARSPRPCAPTQRQDGASPRLAARSSSPAALSCCPETERSTPRLPCRSGGNPSN